MGQNEQHWLEIAIRDPILRIFVGFAIIMLAWAFGNDFRKRLFPPLPEGLKKDESATQQLRAIRDDYRDYVRELRERIDELQEENTDLRRVIKEKTQPIPDLSKEGDEE